jgi:hypothetical protein
MTFREPSTDTQPQPAPPRARRGRLGLSATQLIASALAAITATIAASYLGVSGTVVGAAVASVLTAIGNAVYGHSLRSTGNRVREVVPAAARFGPRAVPTAPVLPAAGPRVRPDLRPTDEPVHPWRRYAFGAAAVFVAVLAVVTSVEVVAGRPVSDLLRGDSGSGTTLFGGTSPARATKSGSTDPAGVPTVTQTVTPSVVVTTPTVTKTAAPTTETTTPTGDPSAPSTPGTSGTATKPTGAATPSQTTSP